MWPAITGVVVAVLVMHLVALTVDTAWVGFRGGNIFFALAPALAANGLARLWSRGTRRIPIALAGLVLAAGLPTTLIDAFDVRRGEPQSLAGRGACAWRRRRLQSQSGVSLDGGRDRRPNRSAQLDSGSPAPTAVVQAEPTVRGRETWSLIPTFAERRMATGMAIPLLARPIYHERNTRVREIYATPDARAAWLDARALGIDYLYVDREEQSAYTGVSKFDTAAGSFHRCSETPRRPSMPCGHNGRTCAIR